MSKLTDVARAAATGSISNTSKLFQWMVQTSEAVDQAVSAPRMVPGLYSCNALVNVSDAVYVSAANTVARAKADQATTLPAVGIVISKPSATSCMVVYGGEVDVFSGLVAGSTYYVSVTTVGAITANPGGVPGQYQQRIGVAKDGNTLVVMAGDATLLKAA